MAHWTENQELPTGYWRLWLLLKIYKIFGRNILKIALFPVVTFAYFFMTTARKASKEYFDQLYQYTKDEKYYPGLRNTFKHLFSFAETLLDRVAAWNGDIKNQALMYEDPAAVEEFIKTYQEKRGIFILSSHLGNIEILRALALDEFDNTVVNAFMDINQTKGFNSFIEKTNPKSKLNLYPISEIGMQTAFMAKDKLDAGEMFVMAADRVPAGNQKYRVKKEFLGKKAAFPLGAFKFAKMMEVDICFLAICYAEDKKYHVYLQYHKFPPALKLSEFMDIYVSWLEKLTLLYPYQWYNFYNFWN